MSFEKYETVLTMLEAGYVGIPLEECEALWDKVFDYIHNNFTPPADVEYDADFQASMDVLKDRTKAHANMKKIPPVLLESVFPIAVASYFLCADADAGGFAGNIRHRKLKTFSEFHKRYGNIILGR